LPGLAALVFSEGLAEDFVFCAESSLGSAKLSGAQAIWAASTLTIKARVVGRTSDTGFPRAPLHPAIFMEYKIPRSFRPSRLVSRSGVPQLTATGTRGNLQALVTSD
jgi:hypothetical protein